MGGLLSVLLCRSHGQEAENRPAQRDSGISNPGHCPQNTLCPHCPYCPLDLKTTPAQRDSGISKLRMGLIRVMRVIRQNHKSKNTFPQLDSEMSNLKVETETIFTQLNSKMSNLKLCPYCPSCLLCLVVSKKSSAQLDSEIYNLNKNIILTEKLADENL